MGQITREELKQKLDRTPPDNYGRREGYALINVLDRQTFLDGHIPRSINVPKGHESGLEQMYDKNKEMILYCASPQCPASKTVARTLEEAGFTNVLVYEGGMSEWEAAGFTVETGEGDRMQEAAA